MIELIRGFWVDLKYPAIALAPMDGVTDAAFRYVVSKHSDPAFTMTEFTNVEGLARGATKMLTAFLYCEQERPVVAQIYGVEVESYYKAVVMLCAMGFDGVDINMGCPANKVAKRGSGAGLIRTPDLAKELIRTCKKASKDWANGITMEEAGVHPDIIDELRTKNLELRTKNLELRSGEKRSEIPISVKTRIGFDKNVAVEWTKTLMEEMPANITMHGRTLKQMYEGSADWDTIAEAGKVCKGSGVSFLGNGDVQSQDQAKEYCEKYGVNGVLIGRAAMGNPWIFKDGDFVPSVMERLDVLLEHCNYFEKLGHMWFQNIKKHLAWYCKEFPGARELRMKLMQSLNFDEVRAIISEIKADLNG